MTKQVLLISTKDMVADEFGPIGMSNNEKSAVRQFEYQMLKMVESPLIRADYALYEVACFDVETGAVITTQDHPLLLKRGIDYVPKDLLSAARKGVADE